MQSLALSEGSLPLHLTPFPPLSPLIKLLYTHSQEGSTEIAVRMQSLALSEGSLPRHLTPFPPLSPLIKLLYTHSQEGSTEIAVRMQSLALSEGSLPRHLHTALFTSSHDNRMLTVRSAMLS